MSSQHIESETTAPTRDLHRALASLQEELEAIDYYQQRSDAATDAELKEILLHNRDEEVEHAVMLLEWIRRRLPVFDAQFKTYLFSKGRLTAIEDAAENAKGGAGGRDGDLKIGKLR